VNDGGKTTLEESIKYLPNMAALDPDTTVTAFREFKPKKNVVEYTIFYREPGQEKYRIDAEFDVTKGEPTPHTIRIVRWGKAAGAITL